jgi:hypothetical protein
MVRGDTNHGGVFKIKTPSITGRRFVVPTRIELVSKV